MGAEWLAMQIWKLRQRDLIHDGDKRFSPRLVPLEHW